ncbi:exodeoxyribonuclease VII large subunit [Pararhizobium haloflavum]|uniref:exodeoxyribonuclease VII large subunit n=1 Tax=Pararhizobium haloflavum TaxID=2037914 RepID=UPI000C181976|nr:exodeoxyribonuclease VII large subunit [Pararhizobium haloflavum]
MTDFFSSDSPASAPVSNITEYSVSEISGSIKRTVEDAFGHVRIRGEISGYRGPHSSGHAYFAMKDDRARIEAVIWRGAFSKLKFKPEEGMEMIATGKVTTYPGSSKYQIVIESLEPAGAGALMALLEERRKTLAGEGLFDEDRKKPLPFMPKVIGVVTSPTGAVIRDILHRIRDRFPVHVVVWPVRVQGETTGMEVANAIHGFNALAVDGPIARPDLIIVARGGGSLEDLWGFNDEAAVRAAAASAIPLISAVGHETDWTLIDHAADRRAPTPTGAAEMAVPVRADLEAALAQYGARLAGCVSRHLDQRRQSLRQTARALPSIDMLFALPRRRFDEAAGKLGRALELNTLNKRRAFEARAAQLTPGALETRLRDRGRRVLDLAVRAERIVERRLDRAGADMRRLGSQLTLRPAQIRIERARETIAARALRGDRAMERLFERRRSLMGEQIRVLASLDYKNVLKRGYAIVRDESGRPVPLASQIEADSPVSLQFSDGTIQAQTLGADGTGGEKARPKRAKPSKPVQGSLF